MQTDTLGASASRDYNRVASDEEDFFLRA